MFTVPEGPPNSGVDIEYWRRRHLEEVRRNTLWCSQYWEKALWTEGEDSVPRGRRRHLAEGGGCLSTVGEDLAVLSVGRPEEDGSSAGRQLMGAHVILTQGAPDQRQAHVLGATDITGCIGGA